MDIPWEEIDWRKKAADVLLEHADKIQQTCQDLVEIERRRLGKNRISPDDYTENICLGGRVPSSA